MRSQHGAHRDRSKHRKGKTLEEFCNTKNHSSPKPTFYNRLGHSCQADWGWRWGKTASDHSHIHSSLRPRVLASQPWMPHPRLWPHSSLLFLPPEAHLSSPLSLPGLWTFHDQIYFSPEVFPSRILLLKPSFLPLDGSSLCTHISNFQTLETLIFWTLFSPCVHQAFLSFQPSVDVMIQHFICSHGSPYSAPYLSLLSTF